MDPEKVQNFLESQREAAPEDLQQDFLNLEDFWDRKLWHQLTDLLVTFFQNPSSAPQRLPLFKNFVSAFSEKINQLKLISLGLAAASQCHCELRRFREARPKLTKARVADHERLTFFSDLARQVDKPSSQDAYVYTLVAGAEVKLRLQDLDGANEDLKRAERILDTFNSVENEVHAAFYKISASYHQVCHHKDGRSSFKTELTSPRPRPNSRLSIDRLCYTLHVSTAIQFRDPSHRNSLTTSA